MPFYFCFLSSAPIFIYNLGCREAILLLIHSCNWVFKGCLLSNSHRFTKTFFHQNYRYFSTSNFTVLDIGSISLLSSFSNSKYICSSPLCPHPLPPIFSLGPGLLTVLKWGSWTGHCGPLEDILRQLVYVLYWFFFTLCLQYNAFNDPIFDLKCYVILGRVY